MEVTDKESAESAKKAETSTKQNISLLFNFRFDSIHFKEASLNSRE
jgi:hypothetical protein